MIKLSNVYKAMYGVCFAGSTKNKQRRLVDSVSNNCSQIRDSDGASANSLSTDVLIQASYAAERDAQCDEAIPDNTRYATASSDIRCQLASSSVFKYRAPTVSLTTTNRNIGVAGMRFDM